MIERFNLRRTRRSRGLERSVPKRTVSDKRRIRQSHARIKTFNFGCDKTSTQHMQSRSSQKLGGCGAIPHRKSCAGGVRSRLGKACFWVPAHPKGLDYTLQLALGDCACARLTREGPMSCAPLAGGSARAREHLAEQDDRGDEQHHDQHHAPVAGEPLSPPAPLG